MLLQKNKFIQASFWLIVFSCFSILKTTAQNDYFYPKTGSFDPKIPSISGYVSKANIGRISNTAAILVGQEGAGKIILFADDPSYRSYWHGTDRLLLNAVFFGNLVNMN